ncbi:MAG: thioredoxin domain-containing protein, partial [Parafilimonas sp.]
IVSQAEELTNHINNSNLLKINPDDTSKIFSKELLQQIAENILQTADKEWGGFGKAPKFPQTFIIQYLLRHYHFTKYEASLQQALLSLDKMVQGGIYDHLGGGFARYSTDTQWKAPHFEKMLYDNALLLSVMAEAYQLTKKELYAEVIRETIEFIQTELCSPENGFYSALDADSEGIEGKYYVWDKKEIDEILGNESELFCKVYNVTEHGNWEHTNILWLPKSLENIAAELNLSLNELQNKLATSKKKLLQHRQKRIRPSLDDKILLSWNCLMITALCKAYAALGDEKFLSAAEKNIHFLENNFKNSNSEWSHTWKDKVAKYPAFLDDYAALINAYIHLQEATGKQDYLIKASALTEKVILDFSDEELNLFYFTSYNQTDVVVRKKEIYDGAVSSGNAVMAYNLIYLSIIFDNKQWGNRGEAMLHLLGNLIIRYPTSFGFWSCVLQSVVVGIYEIAVIGNNYQNLLKEILSLFIPSKVIQSSIDSEPEFPLLQNKKSNSLKPLIYVCKNYSCYQPVEGVAAMKKILDTS